MFRYVNPKRIFLKGGLEGVLNPEPCKCRRVIEPGTREVQKGNLIRNPGGSEGVLSLEHRRGSEQSFLTLSELHTGKYEDADKDGAQQVQAHGKPTGRGQEQVPGL